MPGTFPGRPACIYLADLSLAYFLFAAQWLPVQGRQSPSVLSGPLTLQGGAPLKLTPPRRGRVGVTHWAHRGQGQCGYSTDSLILQALGWRESDGAHKYRPLQRFRFRGSPCKGAPGPPPHGGSHREAV